MIVVRRGGKITEAYVLIEKTESYDF